MAVGRGGQDCCAENGAGDERQRSGRHLGLGMHASGAAASILTFESEAMRLLDPELRSTQSAYLNTCSGAAEVRHSIGFVTVKYGQRACQRPQT